MTKWITIAGMAGVASSSLAQQGWLLESDIISGFDPVTVTLSATYASSDYAFAGARLDLVADEPGWSDPELLLMGPGTSAGTISGAVVEGVIVGQLHFPPGGIFADPANPIEVWQGKFSTSDFTPRFLSISTRTTQFAVYPDMGSPLSELRTPTEASVLVFVPTPGALPLLAITGVAAHRRRRWPRRARTHLLFQSFPTGP